MLFALLTLKDVKFAWNLAHSLRLDSDDVWERLATAYEGDLDRQLRMLVSIAEPMMLFFMAGIIGTVVVGMLLPVFNLQDLIK